MGVDWFFCSLCVHLVPDALWRGEIPPRLIWSHRYRALSRLRLFYFWFFKSNVKIWNTPFCKVLRFTFPVHSFCHYYSKNTKDALNQILNFLLMFLLTTDYFNKTRSKAVWYQLSAVIVQVLFHTFNHQTQLLVQEVLTWIPFSFYLYCGFRVLSNQSKYLKA